MRRVERWLHFQEMKRVNPLCSFGFLNFKGLDVAHHQVLGKVELLSGCTDVKK